MESGKVMLDFQILESKDPKVLMIADSSMWKHIKDKPAIIEIVIPGRKAPIIHYFQKESVNIFNSLTLGVNCISGCQPLEFVELPDGIYNITLKGSPENLFCKERNYLRDTELKLEIRKLQYLNIEDKQKQKVLSESLMLLDGAEGAILFNNVDDAIGMYRKAADLVEKIKNCKDCERTKHYS